MLVNYSLHSLSMGLEPSDSRQVPMCWRASQPPGHNWKHLPVVGGGLPEASERYFQFSLASKKAFWGEGCTQDREVLCGSPCRSEFDFWNVNIMIYQVLGLFTEFVQHDSVLHIFVISSFFKLCWKCSPVLSLTTWVHYIAVSLQMFLYFSDHGLATCSADHLIILWKDGERESRLRSLMLFHKLEQNGDLQLRIWDIWNMSNRVEIFKSLKYYITFWI